MLERLDDLIRRKATGDRASLARRLGVSVRTVTNLKGELEMLGAKVRFDKGSNSYIYVVNIHFNWSIVDDGADVIWGGRKTSSYFGKRQIICPDGRHLYGIISDK